MDIQKDYYCLDQNNRVICKNQDIDFDFQEALPAYLDDIYRVVKCCVNSYVTGADISFNEIKVFGKVNICITYYNENSGLSYADFEEEFSKSITADNLSDNAFVFADICDKYTSFRLINQRRIDIHLSSVLHIDVYDKSSCPCLESCEGSKLKKDNIKCSYVSASNISKTEFDEEFGIPADSPAIKRIISYCSYITLSDVKIIKDKALIKASVNISVLYTADNENSDILRSEYSFNVSKIIEIPGITENDSIIPFLKIGNVFLKAKNSSGEKLDTINAYGEIIVNSVAVHEDNREVITDAYVPGRNSRCDYSECALLVSGETLSEVKQLDISYDLSADVTQIKELAFNIVSYNLKNSRINVLTRANVLGVNNAGDTVFVTSESEVQIPVNGIDNAILSLFVNSYSYTLNEKGKLTVRAALGLNGYSYNENNTKLISDISVGEEQVDYPSITVYFGNENESVWEIAKAFSSDTDLIKKENAISTDTLDSNKVLIIPRG